MSDRSPRGPGPGGPRAPSQPIAWLRDSTRRGYGQALEVARRFVAARVDGREDAWVCVSAFVVAISVVGIAEMLR